MRQFFGKISGELLNEENEGQQYTAAGIEQVADGIERLHEQRRALDIAGIVLVPGGGNWLRGDDLVKKGVLPQEMADFAGRQGLIPNAVVIAHSLQQRGLAAKAYVSPNMHFGDAEIGDLPPATPQAMHRARELGEIMTIGYGSGKSGQTTDAAVLEHALAYQGAYPEDEVLVTKGTAFHIHDKDPRLYPGEAQPLSRVSANLMLADPYLGGIDRRATEIIADPATSIDMFVYTGRDMAAALVSGVGTTILSQPDIMEYADMAVVFD